VSQGPFEQSVKVGTDPGFQRDALAGSESNSIAVHNLCCGTKWALTYSDPNSLIQPENSSDGAAI
jgi:hypothetical protein